MNNTQAKVIENIKSLMTEGRLEVKSESIDENDYFVSYSIEVGMTEDEGTLARVLCRNYRHFFIGKRGGVKLVSCSMGTHSTSPKSITGLRNSVNYLPY